MKYVAVSDRQASYARGIDRVTLARRMDRAEKSLAH